MWSFENNKVNSVLECRYSRFIASWVNVCHGLRYPVYFDGEFEEWMRSLKVPEEDIRNIMEMAACGKLELEVNARRFIEKSEEYAMFKFAGK